MFITESYYYEDFQVSADPACGLNIILETVEAYDKLAMAMINLEHNAIMTEDADLLEEGTEAFLEAASDVIKRAGQKFLAFLDAVKAKWSSLQAAITEKFLNKEKVTYAMQQMKGKNVEVEVDLTAIKRAQEITTAFRVFNNSNVTTDDLNALSKKLDNLISDTKNKVNIIKVFSIALQFLQYRKGWIKEIDTIKKAYIAFTKDSIKEGVSDNVNQDKNNAVAMQRTANKAIAVVNKGTTNALRICRAAFGEMSDGEMDAVKSAYKNGKKNYKAGVKSQKEAEKNDRSKHNINKHNSMFKSKDMDAYQKRNGIENASVLAQYMFD